MWRTGPNVERVWRTGLNVENGRENRANVAERSVENWVNIAERSVENWAKRREGCGELGLTSRGVWRKQEKKKSKTSVMTITRIRVGSAAGLIT